MTEIEEEGFAYFKIGQNAPIKREEAAAELARQSGSALVQVVGRVLLLYRSEEHTV